MNSMEEDIDILERFLKICDEDLFTEISIKTNGLTRNAIEHLIKEYKELEEYYKEQNEVNAKFILVSLVEETIEEYKNKIDKLYNQKVWNEPMDTIYKNRYVNYINILQELLEKRK